MYALKDDPMAPATQVGPLSLCKYVLAPTHAQMGGRGMQLPTERPETKRGRSLPAEMDNAELFASRAEEHHSLSAEAQMLEKGKCAAMHQIEQNRRTS